MLAEETLCTCAQYLTSTRREESKEHRAKTFHILVLQGNLRMIVRWITKQGTGGRSSAGRAVHQNHGEVDAVAVHQKPGRKPPNRGQSGHVLGPFTEACPRGNHGQHSDGGGGTTLQMNRYGGGALSESPALAPAFHSDKLGATADGRRLSGVVG